MTKTNIGTVTVNNGVASIQLDTSELSEGTYNIITRYNENDNYKESTTDTELIVNSPKTSTVISIDAPFIVGTTNHAIVGEVLTVTATITTSDEQIINEGQVIFTDTDDNILGSSNVTNNTATLQIKYEKAGNNQIIASYTNATNYNNSTTNNTFTIGKASQNVTPIPITVNVGDIPYLKAEIRRATDNELVNEGKGTFKVNGKTIKNAAGRVIYAVIENGIAELMPEDDPQIEVLEEWKTNPVNIAFSASGTINYYAKSLTLTSDNWLNIN